MKKRSKKLLFMTVILFVLIGCSLLAMKLNPEGESIETEEETPITSEKIMSFQRSDVETLSWTVGEQTLCFHLDNETWIYDEDSTFPADQSTLTSLVSRMIDLSSYNVIENVSDFAEYGLDKPVCTIDLGGAVDIQVLIGDTTPMDGLRYVSIGDGNVYMVENSIFSEYNINLLDLMEQEEIPNMADPVTVEINIADSQLTLERRELSIPAEDDESKDTVQQQWFHIFADGEIQLDSSLAANFYDNISSLLWESSVAYDVSQEELALYGLDTPSATLTICYSNDDSSLNAFSVEFGITEDGNCYGRISGSDRIYSINSSYLDTLQNTRVDNLLPVAETTTEE